MGSVALAIPDAIARAFPVPVIAIMSKTSIIPVTVPNNPSKGHKAIRPVSSINSLTIRNLELIYSSI